MKVFKHFVIQEKDVQATHTPPVLEAQQTKYRLAVGFIVRGSLDKINPITPNHTSPLAPLPSWEGSAAAPPR